jgi:hypothetical protein
MGKDPEAVYWPSNPFADTRAGGWPKILKGRGGQRGVRHAAPNHKKNESGLLT